MLTWTGTQSDKLSMACALAWHGAEADSMAWQADRQAWKNSLSLSLLSHACLAPSLLTKKRIYLKQNLPLCMPLSLYFLAL